MEPCVWRNFRCGRCCVFPLLFEAFNGFSVIHCNFLQERRNRLLVWRDNYEKLFFKATGLDVSLLELCERRGGGFFSELKHKTRSARGETDLSVHSVSLQKQYEIMRHQMEPENRFIPIIDKMSSVFL